MHYSEKFLPEISSHQALRIFIRRVLMMLTNRVNNPLHCQSILTIELQVTPQQKSPHFMRTASEQKLENQTLLTV